MPKASDFPTFVRVARLLSSSLDLRTVLAGLLDGVQELLNPTDWSLLLREEDGDGLVFTLVRNASGADLIGHRLEPGEGIAGWVAQNGETQLIPEVREDPRFSARMDEMTGFATRSIVAVPLKAGDRVVGVVELLNAMDERSFDEEDVQILEAYAGFAAVAIENARRHGRLVEMTRTDSLSGLRNSRYFFSCVERAVDDEEAFALVFFDMDGFKTLVDAHGHVRGSAALAEIGRFLKDELEESEVGCRFGGDEFALLLRGANLEAGRRRCEEIRSLLEAQTFLQREQINARLTASFGIAAHPDDPGTAEDLLRLADERMYTEKRLHHRARP